MKRNIALYRWLAPLLAGLLPLELLGCQATELGSLSGETSQDTAPAAKAAPWFQDVTEEVGLNFVHDAGPTGQFFMPQCVGSGAAFFFDSDQLYLLLLQNGGPESKSVNRLFRRLPNGRFQDVSKGSGLDVSGYGMGVAVGDVNNDGHPDIFITEYGRVRLFLNNGNGTFTDITKEAGLDNPLWGTSAAFIDYNRDGWLDLVVVNYITYDPARSCGNSGHARDFCGPQAFNGSVTRLYRNLGRIAGHPRRAVHFQDVTVESGLGHLPGPGLGVFCADFNGDRWPDIFVANDGQANRLWINQKDGTFKEEALLRGLALNVMGQPEANMGVAIGDVDGDGAFDVFVTHLTDETNTLWKQKPPGQFVDETVRSQLSRPQWRGTGFGTVLADFDHDGALDLAVVNGKVKRNNRAGLPSQPAPDVPLFWHPYTERNQLFVNDGQGRFRDISLDNDAFSGLGRVSRGLACVDFDGDGALDLLVTTIGGGAHLYRNVAPKRGHWLMVRAVDPALNRDAYGAEIRVTAGGRQWMRWINPGYSFLCSNDPRAHFGLGPAERVDSIDIVWPDGSEEIFPGQAADRMIVLRRGQGKIKL